METALLRCFCAFDIWCQVRACVLERRHPLTTLVCEASATFAATRQEAAFIRQGRAHSRCPGLACARASRPTCLWRILGCFGWGAAAGSSPSAHATTLALGTPVGEPCQATCAFVSSIGGASNGHCPICLPACLCAYG